MKKLLLLQLRPEDEASDNEFEAFLKFGKLDKTEVERVRMETDGLDEINLIDYYAIIVGGGPSNVSDPDHKKPDHQKQFEAKLTELMDEIIEKDFPFMGACYGIGFLSNHQGGLVNSEYGEDVGAVEITLSNDGKSDPVLAGLDESFQAFVGHKEACYDVPESATLLASSKTCPTQMIRVKNNIYGTQFHPELDSHGLEVRINAYKHHGYFEPHEAEELIDLAHSTSITQPMGILENFVSKYRV